MPLILHFYSSVGGKNYFSAGFKDDSVAGIHDHSGNENLLGIGDFSAVLHGIYFRNNQRDYSLVQPSYSGAYDHTVPVSFPPVPDNVRNAETTEHQIKNMRQWFADFQNGKEIVDKYFKPLMSYVEGVWSNIQPETGKENTKKVCFNADLYDFLRKVLYKKTLCRIFKSCKKIFSLVF